MDSIIIDSIKTKELDTSLDEPGAITSSVSSGSLHPVSTISDNSKPQLGPSIRYHKLRCQARALLAPVPLATKMSTSKLIYYFSSHSIAFEFQASPPPDNIILTPANKRAVQNISEFQTGIGPAAHATLNMEQLISHLRVSLLILFPLYLILREELYLCLKCMNYLSRFIIFWTMLYPSKLGIQYIF